MLKISPLKEKNEFEDKISKRIVGQRVFVQFQMNTSSLEGYPGLSVSCQLTLPPPLPLVVIFLGLKLRGNEALQLVKSKRRYAICWSRL